MTPAWIVSATIYPALCQALVRHYVKRGGEPSLCHYISGTMSSTGPALCQALEHWSGTMSSSSPALCPALVPNRRHVGAIMHHPPTSSP